MRSKLSTHGIHDLLPKPVSMRALRHMIHKWLPRHHALQGAADNAAACALSLGGGSAPGAPGAPTGASTCRILLVEDCQVTRLATEELFQQLGLWIATAADGESAMTMLAKRDFDLVLLDLHLTGMSGYALCSWYKDLCATQKRPCPKIVAITSDPDLEACAEFGIDVCLPKPLTSACVVQALRLWSVPNGTLHSGFFRAMRDYPRPSPC